MIYNKNTISWIIVIVLILIVIFIYFRNTEYFVTNTEAIANISSMYNNGTLSATNLNTTGNARFSGATQGTTNGDGFTWLPHPNGNNYIRGDQTYISGNTDVNANLKVSGNVRFPGATQVDPNGDGFTWLPHPNGNNYIRGDQTYITGKTNVTSHLSVGGNLTVLGNLTSTNGLIEGKLKTFRIPDLSDYDSSVYIINNKYFAKSDPPGTTLYFLTDGGRIVTAIKIDWDNVRFSMTDSGYNAAVI